MVRIAWATDIHLEFVDDRGRGVFIEQLCETEPDVAILAGGAEYGSPRLQPMLELP